MSNDYITVLLIFQNMSDQALNLCQVSSAPAGPYDMQGEKGVPPLTKEESKFYIIMTVI